jgi:hypothetical protein
VRNQHWYRIPVSSVEKWLAKRWPPSWLAFYQTKIFEPEAYAVHYYARVHDIRVKRRLGLFPDQPRDERAQRRYWQLMLGELRRLPTVIANINRLRGLDEGRMVPRRIHPNGPGAAQQLSMFDDLDA